MLTGIIIYAIFLIGMGIYDFLKVKKFEDFVVAGKNQSLMSVFLSLMASIIGASATIGIADRVVQIGFPAFWWLGVGAAGLVLQSVFLSEKIRALDANTLPDVAMKTVGSGGRILLAITIAVSWVGIIAAQFVSMAKLISVVVGGMNQRNLLIVVTITVIIYTMIGGQIAVIKTDKIQSLFIAFGICLTFIYLFVSDSGNNVKILHDIELLNSDFNMMDIINLFFITGGTYFLGPDIVSRNLVSKDGKTAKKAAFAAGIGLTVFSLIITLISLWETENIADFGGQNPLMYIMNNKLPYPCAVILCIALLSALLSSADTCLINAASIIEHDILKRKKVGEIRVIVGILGAVALIIALFKTDIIGLLTGAYSIYAPGVVFPLMIAIIFYKKRNIRKPIWFAAVIIGGSMGILNSYFAVGFEYLPLVGMGISLLLSILSLSKKVSGLSEN